MKSTYLRTTYVLAAAAAFAILFIEIVNVVILRQANYRSGEIFKESLEYYADFWNERLKAVNIEMIHITNIEEATGKDYEILLYTEDNLELQIGKRVMLNRLTQLSSIYGSDIAFFIYLPEKDTLISSAAGNLELQNVKRKELIEYIQRENVVGKKSWSVVQFDDSFYLIQVFKREEGYICSYVSCEAVLAAWNNVSSNQEVAVLYSQEGAPICRTGRTKDDLPTFSVDMEYIDAKMGVVVQNINLMSHYTKVLHRPFQISKRIGGDPILHPDFWRLLGLLKSKDIPFTILGNPFHLNDEVCRKLKEHGCQKYQLSLDGMQKTHDWFRKPSSFDITLEKTGCLKRAGIRAVVMTTVSGTNIKEIPDIIDTVVEHKADVFAFARYCPTSEEKDTGMTPLQYRELLAVCDKKFKEYESAGCEIYFNKKDHLWTLYEYETGEFKIPENAQEGMIYGGCNCGNCHITILPNGDVYACRRVQDSKVSNIFEDRLTDVWVCQMEQYREYDRFEKCSKCELKAWCRGCPAVANGVYGDFYAADPQCWKEIV